MRKNVLVIEDDPTHLEDAKKYFATQENVQVQYAQDYYSASNIMSASDASLDGVISDIYFPLSDSSAYKQPEPIGVRVAIECQDKRTPVVLNTSGYHHGSRYQWIFELAMQKQWFLVDVNPAKGEGRETKSLHKDWEKAFKTLEYAMNHK